MTADLDPLVALSVAGILAPGQNAMAEFDQWRRAQTMQAYRVLGELMERIPPSTRMWRWSIRGDNPDSIEATLAPGIDGHNARATIMLIAEQFSLHYFEKPHLNGKNMVAADGVYSNVPVRIFELVQPCGCGECGAPR